MKPEQSASLSLRGAFFLEHSKNAESKATKEGDSRSSGNGEAEETGGGKEGTGCEFLSIHQFRTGYLYKVRYSLLVCSFPRRVVRMSGNWTTQKIQTSFTILLWTDWMGSLRNQPASSKR